jgi:hypothetical protein
MKTKFALAFMVAIFALATFTSFASAELNITEPRVKVNDLSVALNEVAVIGGETYPVSIKFLSNQEASDVEISAWIQGEREDRVDRSFQDLITGSEYNARLSVVIPDDIDPEEDLTLIIRLESDEGNFEREYTLKAQRESDRVDFLLIDMDSEARPGETVAITVVLKNMGRQEAEDTFVTVKVPTLGLARSAYFEDLFPVDGTGDNDDDEDSRERKVFLTIPENATPGIYDLEVTAFNDNEDFETIVSKTLSVNDALVQGSVLSSPSNKQFSVGQEVVYELILVNSGDEITVYNLAPKGSDALSISLSESFATVPAGMSKTVQVYVKANREGTHNFAVDVNSNGFSETALYSASVEGRSFGGGSSNIVALTIVLAIIFIVLVIILAVLLTRKPDRTEEFGESYY